MINDVPQEAHKLLLTGKQFFCYDYLSDTGKLDEQVLPAREHFYNHLKNDTLSEDNYEHTLKVFNTSGCIQYFWV